MKLISLASLVLLTPLFLVNPHRANAEVGFGEYSLFPTEEMRVAEALEEARFIRPWSPLIEQETTWQQAQQQVELTQTIASGESLEGIPAKTLEDWHISVGGEYPLYGNYSLFERLTVQFEKVNRDWENSPNTVERDFRNTNGRFPFLRL
ncbi:hypothetical protein IQ249_16045 [Lusitaniella coriacea LEGE 07157]|uniref:Uncharacterized protein n=1 Tax=Lusitaniella coriacea LEGE 07157 TaxID=945747 RepID=A0A8J7DXS6_9CYAN|nr:hypothetical protein [Lusitaniella coriacea]MBE9117412.1 hypothetical protein [Lusitaniella coriacea LEGE 07157]